jgi:replication-associated recombination protein RarA
MGMTGDLGHLLPECREEAKLPAEERIERIQAERWISYPRAELTLRRMAELLRYPQRDRMPSLLLYGPTGMGKTKIIRKFVRDHPAVFDTQVGILESRVVAMQMPPEPDEKSFYSELLGALQVPISSVMNVHQLRRVVRELMQFVRERMLIIDEVHTLLASSYRQQRILLNTLRYLANDLRIPLVCAGTADAKRALTTDQQLADRFEAFELPRWHNDESFARLLASFQSVLPLRQHSDLLAVPIRRLLLERTEGITVRIVRLLETAAIDAITNGWEKIDYEKLSGLSAVAPLLSMSEYAGIHSSST